MEFTNQATAQADLGNSAVPLTPREKEVLRLLAQGKQNKIIAYELHLTTGTIKEYCFFIYKKIGVGTRLQAALWARDHHF